MLCSANEPRGSTFLFVDDIGSTCPPLFGHELFRDEAGCCRNNRCRFTPEEKVADCGSSRISKAADELKEVFGVVDGVGGTHWYSTRGNLGKLLRVRTVFYDRVVLSY